MLLLFPIVKSAVRQCPTCGRPTTHEKVGTQHALHFMVMFFTFFLWTPVWVLCALLERARPFRCKDCLSVGTRPRPVTRKAG